MSGKRSDYTAPTSKKIKDVCDHPILGSIFRISLDKDNVEPLCAVQETFETAICAVQETFETAICGGAIHEEIAAIISSMRIETI